MIKSCLGCDHHELKDEEGVRSSHCLKENCWARFSKCLRMKAWEKFLQDERSGQGDVFRAIEHVYGRSWLEH